MAEVRLTRGGRRDHRAGGDGSSWRVHRKGPGARRTGRPLPHGPLSAVTSCRAGFHAGVDEVGGDVTEFAVGDLAGVRQPCERLVRVILWRSTRMPSAMPMDRLVCNAVRRSATMPCSADDCGAELATSPVSDGWARETGRTVIAAVDPAHAGGTARGSGNGGMPCTGRRRRRPHRLARRGPRPTTGPTGRASAERSVDRSSAGNAIRSRSAPPVATTRPS